MNAGKSFLSPSKLKDPNEWFLKAQRYRSVVLLLHQEYLIKVRDGEPINDAILILDAINTVPYITCLGLELYMKGYLISQGSAVHHVEKYRHKIWDIRSECYKISKKNEFNNLDLKYLTDKLGAQILEGGGVRYPGVRDSIVPVNSCILALNLMHDLLRNVINAKHA